MELRRLGQSGLKVSVLSLGAMTFGESHSFMKGVTSPDDEARRIFDRAIDAGVNLVDTANVYSEGRSEELTGEWIQGKRDKVLLATKCRFPIGFGQTQKPGPWDMGLSRKHILEACEASLRRLKTDVIDLYQTHMQDSTTPIEETLRALDDLVTQGKVRYIGCSNYAAYRLVESLWAAEKLHTHHYQSVQMQWSLAVRGAEREVVPACRAHGIGTLVWSPLARGFLSGKYHRNHKRPAGARLETWEDSWKSLDNDRTWAILDTVRQIAQRREVSCAEIALAWLLSKPEVSTIIIGARTLSQLEDNLKATQVGLLPEELAELDKVSMPDWDYPYDFIVRSDRL